MTPKPTPPRAIRKMGLGREVGDELSFKRFLPWQAAAKRTAEAKSFHIDRRTWVRTWSRKRPWVILVCDCFDVRPWISASWLARLLRSDCKFMSFHLSHAIQSWPLKIRCFIFSVFTSQGSLSIHTHPTREERWVTNFLSNVFCPDKLQPKERLKQSPFT